MQRWWTFQKFHHDARISDKFSRVVESWGEICYWWSSKLKGRKHIQQWQNVKKGCWTPEVKCDKSLSSSSSASSYDWHVQTFLNLASWYCCIGTAGVTVHKRKLWKCEKSEVHSLSFLSTFCFFLSLRLLKVSFPLFFHFPHFPPFLVHFICFAPLFLLHFLSPFSTSITSMAPFHESQTSRGTALRIKGNELIRTDEELKTQKTTLLLLQQLLHCQPPMIIRWSPSAGLRPR